MPTNSERRWPLGARGAVLVGLLLLGAAAALALHLAPSELVPTTGGAQLAGRFFSAALQPAFTYESEYVPAGTPPFLVKLGVSLLRTIVFAAAAISLAIAVGLPLGFLASDAWWRRDSVGGRVPLALARPAQVGVRVAIALLRSVHELLWAVLFLAAMGLNTGAAVVAIALPYSGTLAKVFSEMLDEAPRNTAAALTGMGAPPLAVFLYGLVPRALPDMAAYAFYRFECAVRASAILGFFGYETIGYHLRLSFEDLHYREVWTYLYALVLLVLALEAWSGALRRRFVS